MTHQHQPTSPPLPAGLSRRSVTRGAAWAVPVVATATAAPALAASGVPNGPATFVWLSVTWSPSATGISSLTARAGVDNPGQQSITLLSVEAHTTYQAPAANLGRQRVVAVRLGTTSWNVPARGQLAFDVSFSNQYATPTPPKDANGTDISRSYYGGTADGKVPCVSSFVTSTDPRYPYAARRLTLDSAYLQLTYSAGATTYAAQSPMSNTVRGLVTGSYCTS